MSTSSILVNLVMSTLLLAGLGAGLLAVLRMGLDSGHGRAFGRGPFPPHR